MSNRIDFFQSAQTQLAIPAATAAVFLDETICPDLEVIEIVHSGWPEFSWARLTYNPTARQNQSSLPVEQLEADFAMGRSVSIRHLYNGIPPGVAAFSLPIFEGQIEALETNINSNGEQMEIIAKDFSSVLSRITVYGQRISNNNDSTIFLAGLNTIFNPDGMPNAGQNPSQYNGKWYTVFCAEPSQSRFFSLAEVIDYLISEYLPDSQIQTPSIEQLRAITDDRCVRDLEVTGLNLAEALHRCCEEGGLKFIIVPRFCEVGPKQAIVFYKNGTGRTVELDCQQKGQRLSISSTNIAELFSRKNFWPVTHKYIGQGDFKVYEATFELVKAWDQADEEINYDKFSPSTNSQFYKVKDVYRKWCLNEAGDYSGQPFSQGEPFDFSRIFQTGNFTRRRRRFWPALSADKNGKSLGYFLQVSYDGVNWWQYMYAFNNLLDECGIWLSSDRLDINTWIAALKKVLRFRITASVVSDERLSCEAADGPVGSAAAVVERVISSYKGFKFRKVSNQSIFANTNDLALGVPDIVDDSVALYEFVRHHVQTTPEVIETIEVTTPSLIFDYRVGDKVSTGQDCRDLLGCRGDSRSKYVIEKVGMDFQKQCTNLKIVRKR